MNRHKFWAAIIVTCQVLFVATFAFGQSQVQWQAVNNLITAIQSQLNSINTSINNALPSGTAVNGQIIIGQTSTRPVWATVTGDISSSSVTPGLLRVTGLSGALNIVTTGNLSQSTGLLSLVNGDTTGASVVQNTSVNGLFNVKAWGAKGDNSTDDTAHIQSAINAMCAAVTSNPVQAPSLYFSAGRYKTTASLIDNCNSNGTGPGVAFVGDNRSSAVIVGTGNAYPLVVLEADNLVSSIGNIFGTSLLTGSGNSLSLPGNGNWYLRLNDVNTGSGTGAFQNSQVINGLSAFSIEGAFKNSASTSGTSDYVIMASAGNVMNLSNFQGLRLYIHSASGSPCLNGWMTFSSNLVSKVNPGGNCGASLSSPTATHTFEFNFSSGTIRLFLDGVLGASTTYTGTLAQTFGEELVLGIDPSFTGPNASGTNAFQGNLDSIRLSNIARHTSNFTPPTAKFTSDSNTLYLNNFQAQSDINVEVDSVNNSGTPSWQPIHTQLGVGGHNTTLNTFQGLSFLNGTFGVFEQNALYTNFSYDLFGAQSESSIYCPQHCYGWNMDGDWFEPASYAQSAVGLFGDSGLGHAKGLTIFQPLGGIIDSDSGDMWDEVFFTPGTQSQYGINNIYEVDQYGQSNYSHITVDQESGGSTYVPITVGGQGIVNVANSSLQAGSGNDTIQICSLLGFGALVLDADKIVTNGSPAEYIRDFADGNGPGGGCSLPLTPISLRNDTIDRYPVQHNSTIPVTTLANDYLITQPVPYTVATLPGATGPDWAANHNYTQGAILTPTTQNTGGFSYLETVSSCTSSGSRPSPFTQTIGASTSDNTCTWKNVAYSYCTNVNLGQPVNVTDCNSACANPGAWNYAGSGSTLIPAQCSSSNEWTELASLQSYTAQPSYLLGQGTALQTSATTAYFFPYLTIASTATEGNAELPAPQTVTYTKLNCTFSAAQGSAKSDAITFVDVTNACATALTCTATNNTGCNNLTTPGLCPVTVGDQLTFQDVTTGTGITARSGTCTVSP